MLLNVLKWTSVLVVAFALSDDPFRPAVSHYHQVLDGSGPPARGVAESESKTASSRSSLEALVEGRFAALGLRVPETDPAMRLAAARLASVFRLSDHEEVVSGNSDLIRFILFLHGITDSFTFPVIAHLDHVRQADGLLATLISADLAKLGLNRYAVVWDPETSNLALLFSKRLVRLSPFPIAADPGTAHLLWGSMEPGVSAPSLYMATPGGSTIQSQPKVSGELFWSQVYLPEEPGEYMLEILVQEDGAQVASLFPVYVGTTPPVRPVTRLYAELPADASESQLETRMMELVNQERTSRSIPKLKWDPILARTARAHSNVMASNKRLSHVSEAPVPSQIRGFQENISLSTSLSSAHSNLMGSPSHRRNVLSRDHTRAGIGIVKVPMPNGRYLLYVTQRFAGKGGM
jgi:uncharacterized protein YkwD